MYLNSIHNYFQDCIMSMIIPPKVSGNWTTVQHMYQCLLFPTQWAVR